MRKALKVSNGTMKKLSSGANAQREAILVRG
jgi:hypothetical protein